MLLKIGIALLALGLIAGVGTVVFWDGPDRDRTVEYRVVNEGGTAADGQVIVVSDDDRHRPFFPFFPLIIVGGVLVTIALVSRGRGGGWGGPHGRFEDWHREAHRETPPASSGS